ncbi:transposase [Micromonospora inaquosa]|uniref:transposase n=1 Tax=Micromonospora inaquosa TaxID=2203716 RepID=UPI003F4D16FA
MADKKKAVQLPEPTAAEVEFAQQLVEWAKADGVSLVGPGGLLAGITRTVLESALDAELDAHLEEVGVDEATGRRTNIRNGHGAKTVQTEVGPVRIQVPRDRAGSFAPRIVPKHVRRLDGFNEAILSLHAKGLTTGEISAQRSARRAESTVRRSCAWSVWAGPGLGPAVHEFVLQRSGGAAPDHFGQAFGLGSVGADPRALARVEDLRQAADALGGVPATPRLERDSDLLALVRLLVVSAAHNGLRRRRARPSVTDSAVGLVHQVLILGVPGDPPRDKWAGGQDQQVRGACLVEGGAGQCCPYSLSLVLR